MQVGVAKYVFRRIPVVIPIVMCERPLTDLYLVQLYTPNRQQTIKISHFYRPTAVGTPGVTKSCSGPN